MIAIPAEVSFRSSPPSLSRSPTVFTFGPSVYSLQPGLLPISMPASISPLPLDWATIARVLDANANRAEEGLRVIEEYVRFALEDPQLTADYKQLRHDLAATLAAIPERSRLLSRDTPGDVGTRIGVADEYRRSGVREVALASHKRLEQSLRCLEEYVKPLQPDVAPHFEALRYRAYTLAQRLYMMDHSQSQLARRRFYVLVEGASSGRHFGCSWLRSSWKLGQTSCNCEKVPRRPRALGTRPSPAPVDT